MEQGEEPDEGLIHWRLSNDDESQNGCRKSIFLSKIKESETKESQSKGSSFKKIFLFFLFSFVLCQQINYCLHLERVREREREEYKNGVQVWVAFGRRTQANPGGGHVDAVSAKLSDPRYPKYIIKFKNNNRTSEV